MATNRRITRLSMLAFLAGTTVPLRAQGIPANLQATVTGPTTVALTWTAVASDPLDRAALSGDYTVYLRLERVS